MLKNKETMKKILITYSARIPTVEIVCAVMSDLAQVGKIFIRERALIEVKKADIEWSELVLAIRPFDISAHNIVKAAKQAKREVIIYLDDDLLHLPHIYSSTLRKFFTMTSFNKNCEYLKDMLGMCDVLWGSSPFLIGKYKAFVQRGRCVYTNVGADVRNMKIPSGRSSKINIFYAGSGNHYKQLNEFVIPAINELVEKYPGIVLTCFGMRKVNIAECRAQLITRSWQTYDEYYQSIKGMSFDIGVAPLLQEDFYRCKYFNKYIEYSLLGIVGIYTNDYPYLNVIHDKENGLMAENTVQSWKEKIEYAVSHENECRRMIFNAQKDCSEHYGRDSQIEEVRKYIPEFFEKNNDELLSVNFTPYTIIDSARKYANSFVAFYEGLKK